MVSLAVANGSIILLEANHLAKVSLEKSVECFAMASFISADFMNSVMDGVEVQSFCALCDVNAAFSGTEFSVNAGAKVLFGRSGENFAEQFCKLGSVISLFESSGSIVLADFRIALTDCLTGHSKVHTDLRALTVKASTKIFFDVFRSVSSYAENMLSSPGSLISLLDKLAGRCFADRANEIGGKRLAFIDVTANAAYEFFHNINLQKSFF